jgi:ribonuclease R
MRQKKNKKIKAKTGFSKRNLFSSIRSLYKGNPSLTMNYKQVAKKLNIRNQNIKMLICDLLEELKGSSYIKEIKRGHFRLNLKNLCLIGVVKNTSRKGVYVSVGDFDYFVPIHLSMFSLTGDDVEITVYSVSKKKKLAEITKVIKRKKDAFVGFLDVSLSGCFLVPDNKKTPFDIFVPKSFFKPHYKNKKVLVSVTSWESEGKNPIGKITRVLGEKNNHYTAIDSIIYDHGLVDFFEKPLLDFSNKKTLSIDSSIIKSRLDFRNTNTFTIDPKDAKDFDDALSVKKLSDNLWEIGVHIADVSFYVKNSDLLDNEAKKRGNSVYLADRVIPMLPENLSNDICSLKPNVDRLAFSVIFKIDNTANIKDFSFSETIICSDHRFTYESAQDCINNKTGVFFEELSFLNKTAKLLKNNRISKGSINFESSDIKFLFDKYNVPVGLSHKNFLDTNSLIEEFMLLANKTVATYINNNYAFNSVYRVHDKPDIDKLSILSKIAKQFDYNYLFQLGSNLPKTLNAFLNETLESGKKTLFQNLVASSMAKAKYTTKNIGHFGLAFSYYSHFTSPIRRYPDLLIHRILKSILKIDSFFSLELEGLCKHCSERERNASLAERASFKYMQALYFKNKIGDIFDGKISAITEWGIYVTLNDSLCEGLIKLSSMTDDHYIYNNKEFCLTGYSFNKTYNLGQNIKVKILKSDLDRKQLYLSIINP